MLQLADSTRWQFASPSVLERGDLCWAITMVALVLFCAELITNRRDNLLSRVRYGVSPSQSVSARITLAFSISCGATPARAANANSVDSLPAM